MRLLSCADIFCKQFKSRSNLTFYQSCSGSSNRLSLIVSQKEILGFHSTVSIFSRISMTVHEISNQCRSRSAVSDEASGSGSKLLFFQINTFLASEDFCRIADNLCKSFRSRSGPTFCLACIGSKLVVIPKAISDVLSLCILKMCYLHQL